MTMFRHGLVAGFMLVLTLSVTVQSQDLSDPYEILARYFEARGGLDRLKAEKRSYFEATLEVAGLTGTLKVWTQYPELTRSEFDLTALKITQGDNGTFTWTLDSNGKLQKATKEDEITRQRRELKRRVADYEYADPTSRVFSVSLNGHAKYNDQDCYAVIVTNALNSDTLKYYINSSTFLLELLRSVQGNEGSSSFPGDYRQVDGLTVPFYFFEQSHLTGQEQEVTVTSYQSNPPIDPALFEPPTETVRDYAFDVGDRSENLPFRFIGLHLYIPVIVGGKERLWILDTGAGMTVIDKDFAAELGLTTVGDMQGAGAGGNVAVSFTSLPPYTIRGISFNEQKVAVIEMDQLNRILGLRTAGILGFDFLSRFVTRIDYANELISFYDPETFVYSGDGTTLDVHLKEQVFETSASLDGRLSGLWLFDIGAGGVSLDPAHAARAGYATRTGVIGIGAGAGNTFESKRLKCDSIQLAGFTIAAPQVSLRVGGQETGAVPDRLGLLGNSLFRNFVVYCDYKNERVILERGSKFNQPWPEDRSGLQLMVSPGWEHFEVMYVQAGTPAAKAGFKVGDTLKSVNGIDTEQLDGINSLRRILSGQIGEKVEIIVKRARGEARLELALSDLFAE